MDQSNKEKADLIQQLSRTAQELADLKATPEQQRIAELLKTVEYLTEELDKETAHVIEYAKREKMLKEDHRKTWMELRSAQDKLKEMENRT